MKQRAPIVACAGDPVWVGAVCVRHSTALGRGDHIQLAEASSPVASEDQE